MHIRLDKIASATTNVEIGPHVRLTTHIPALPGTLVAVRVLDDKDRYNQLEDRHGRMMTVHRGDVIAGVLGERRALRGYAGVVPNHVQPGDTLHLLNLGGVIGLCTSASPEVGPPARVEVIGGIVGPDETAWADAVAASIRPGKIRAADTLQDAPPAIFMLGSCMSAGKTAAAATVVRELTRAGLRVGVAKVTGVSLRRDTLDMVDHGAVAAFTFTDAGLPSTCVGDAAASRELVRAARGCLNALGREGVDVAVIEFGDGLLGDYGVMDLLAAADLRAAAQAVVFAATDPVAAWGGITLLEQRGVTVDVVTGPATDNDAGCGSIRQTLGVAAANARKQPELLGKLVLAALERRAAAVTLPQQEVRA